MLEQNAMLPTHLHDNFNEEENRREQTQKVYVQNLVEEVSKLVWNKIEKEGAYVYVCGGTNMGIDVSSTLRRIAFKFGGLKDEESAKKYLSNLQSVGIFVQELWA